MPMQEYDATVEQIIADISPHGRYGGAPALLHDSIGGRPPRSGFSPSDIEDIIASLPRQVISDIQFTQAQVRTLAQHQRARPYATSKVETLPGA